MWYGVKLACKYSDVGPVKHGRSVKEGRRRWRENNVCEDWKMKEN
jgi:hypothetical protein